MKVTQTPVAKLQNAGIGCICAHSVPEVQVMHSLLTNALEWIGLALNIHKNKALYQGLPSISWKIEPDAKADLKKKAVDVEGEVAGTQSN